tara:strand:+ start:402 stop:1445 length:1044 start_codon:yes stop_codon:yes gene_type:complete
MAYASITKPSLHHECNLYQANGSGKTISGMGFRPDMIWTKNRSTGSYIPAIVDVVRGGTKKIFTSNTDAEATDSNAVTSFTSDGYVFGSSGSFNYSTDNYVNWCWKAGGGQGSSNTDGSINTTYTSVDTTGGFSISTYTGAGSNATVGHGLGVAPQVVWIKRLSNVDGMVVGHKSMGFDNIMKMDRTNAKAASSNYFQDTAPSSSVVSIGSDTGVGDVGNTYVMYAFAEKKGYSKFGSYTGNGNSDGTFIYTGFRPAWIMLKRTDSADWWGVWDDRRLGYNPDTYHMRINESNYTENAKHVDQLSNGFKIRETDTAINGSGGNYIYMAFAAEPLVANVGASIPATAF